MQELTFIIGPDRPAAELWEAIGNSGVAMEASCTYPSIDGRNVRIVVTDDDAQPTRSAAVDAGFGAIDQHEVLIANIDVRPGGLGDLARKVADSGTKVHILYMATGNRVVVGADDLETAAEALGI
ncbi:MAG: hypothetical protein ACC683_09985 [Acidimicrobiia bacterium]